MRKGAMIAVVVLALAPVPLGARADPKATASSEKERWVVGDWIFEDDFKKLVAVYGTPLEPKLKAIVLNDPAVKSLLVNYDAVLSSAKAPALAAGAKVAAPIDASVVSELRSLRKAREAAHAGGDEVDILVAEKDLRDARERGLRALRTSVASTVDKSAPAAPYSSDAAFDEAWQSAYGTVSKKTTAQSPELGKTMRKAALMFVEHEWEWRLRFWNQETTEAIIGKYRVKWLALSK